MFETIKRIVKTTIVRLKMPTVYFARGADIGRYSVFEGQNKIGIKSRFDGYMGYGTYIGDECNIIAKVGRFCSIGNKVNVLIGTHPSHKYVSTSPVFYSLLRQNGTTFVNKQKFREILYADETNKYGVIIGNDVWIGYNATIIGGVKIGDGAIIASGAFVNSSIEPYTIVAGQPAKVISKRFTDEQAEWLKKYKWWDKPLEWIKEHAEEFDDINRFVQVHHEEE
jgi:acetyltransferase-like isoleucine patch superfamily enzyme